MSETIKDYINVIAEREGFLDYSFEMKAGSNEGDNYVGVLTAIKITGTKREKPLQKAELHLMCKTPPLEATLKRRPQPMFSREIYVYSKLLPAFVRFQQEKGLSEADSFLSFPKVYASEVNEEKGVYILIMENLRAKNYEMWPKEKTIDVDHELVVMQELGKFHAVSFAMKDQRPNEFEEFKILRDSKFEHDLKEQVGTFIKANIEMTTETLISPQHKRLMQKFQTTYENMIEDYLLGPSSNDFAIVTHSDCWSNNILFQYDDKRKLRSVSILDWQIARYSPPVLDILYNIFSSTDKSFRVQHYTKLLETYHTTLSETIHKLGSDPNKLYTYEDFQRQLRKFGDFTLLCAPLLISLRVAQPKDTSDDVENTRKRKKVLANIHSNEETQTEYSRLINELLTDLVEYGYIQVE